MKNELSRFYVQHVIAIEDVTSIAHKIGKAHEEGRDVSLDVPLPVERAYFPRPSTNSAGSIPLIAFQILQF